MIGKILNKLSGDTIKAVAPGYYALIVWKPIAQRQCAGNDMLKEIHFYAGKSLHSIENYSPFRPEQIVESGIPIYDLTAGEGVPSNCSDNKLSGVVRMGLVRVD